MATEKSVKAHVYRNLESEGIRTAKSYEFKMQNISAVLALNDLPFVRGLAPAKNFQRSLEPQVLAFLDAIDLQQHHQNHYMANCAPHNLSLKNCSDSQPWLKNLRRTIGQKLIVSVVTAPSEWISLRVNMPVGV